MRTSIYALGLVCIACGGEAHQAAAPSAPSQPAPERSPVIVLSSEPEADPAAPHPKEPEPEPTLDRESLVQPGWSAEECRGKALDLEELRAADRCLAKAKPDMAAPSALKLVAPPRGTLPRGKRTAIYGTLVNTGKRRVGFVITTGDGFPSMAIRELRRGTTEVEGGCLMGMLTTAQWYYIELEPGGRLKLDGRLIPTESLDDVAIDDCAPQDLPPGNDYHVELSVSVNRESVSADWPFEIL